MEDSSEASENRPDGHDPSLPNCNISEDPPRSPLQNDALLPDFEALQISYQALQSKFTDLEETVIVLQQGKDQITQKNVDLVQALEKVSLERDALHVDLCTLNDREDELVRQRDVEFKENSDLPDEIRAAEDCILEFSEEKISQIRALSESVELLKSAKVCMEKILEQVDDEKSQFFSKEDEVKEEHLDLEEESKSLVAEVTVLHKLAMMAECQIAEYKEKKQKEIKLLENSVVSLTEENRDISSLFRIALVEKEAAEKTLNRLKGSGEQKRVALLQFAEKGLQKVGFGFMMGTSTGDSLDNLSTNTNTRPYSSESEEEGVSLVSSMEKIMKNLRLEITHLKQSLEESRSDNERLQCLSEKQAQRIAECTLYIKDLEEREVILTQNVEELMMELTEAEEDVARWKEACELEVEAGKTVIEERDRESAFLKEELVKAKASLELLTNELKLKEELATAAMVAQEAAERSLRLADSRSAGLHERIEELTRQIEEAESRGERSSRRRVRHVCCRGEPSGSIRLLGVAMVLGECYQIWRHCYIATSNSPFLE